jgi:hypothetical protein
VNGRKLCGLFAQEGELRGTPPPRSLSVCPIMAEAAKITDSPRLHSNPPRTAIVHSGATERVEAQRPPWKQTTIMWQKLFSTNKNTNAFVCLSLRICRPSRLAEHNFI